MKMNWNCIYQLFIFALAVILLLPLNLHAQLPLLPLKEGNFWIYDSVLGDKRNNGIAEIKVHEEVGVLPVTEDTYYWHDTQTPFGNFGTKYFKLSLTGYTHLFPHLQPDTLLVRSDSKGNIWSRGYILKGTTRIMVEDQPWLMVNGPWNWNLRFSNTNFSIGYVRYQWIGWCRDGVSEIWRRFDEFGLENLYCFDPKWVPFAQKYRRDLTPQSPQRLFLIEADLNGNLRIEHGRVSTVIMSGLGPLWIFIPTDMAELSGIHLELAKAQVDNLLIWPSQETSVRRASWGGLKSSR